MIRPRSQRIHLSTRGARLGGRLSASVAVFVLLSVGASSIATAQTAQDLLRAQRQLEQQLQLEQQRLARERQERQDRQPIIKLEPLPLYPPKPSPSPTGADPSARAVPEACHVINTIDLLGADAVPYEDFQPIIVRRLDKCLKASDIEALLAELYKIYIDRGFVAARIFLTPQDLSSGKLEFRVLEGQISQIRIEDGGKASISKDNVFPGLEGRPLNLRDIEQGLEQVNRLPSNSAKMSISPGSNPGDSIVTVENKPGSPFKANVTMDDLGAESTGKLGVSVNMSYDNPLGLNDSVSINRKQSILTNQNEKYSVSNGINYAVPYGYYTASVGFNESESISTLTLASGTQLQSVGDNRSYFYKLERMMHRDQFRRWTLGGTLTHKSTENYLGGAYLDTTSRKLTVLDLDSNLTLNRPGGTVLGVSAGLSKGLSWLGGLQDPAGIGDYSAHAQFTKLRGGVTVDKPLSLFDQKFNLSSQLSGQYSLDTLYGSEQFSIGGFYTIRGYSTNSLSGDHGILVRNELSTRKTLSIAGESLGLKPYGGFDFGKVIQKAPGATEGAMSGGFLGLSVNWRQYSFDLTASKGFRQPGVFTKEEGTLVNFKVSGSL
jgi:hemolysin activation/secretion protein